MEQDPGPTLLQYLSTLNMCRIATLPSACAMVMHCWHFGK